MLRFIASVHLLLVTVGAYVASQVSLLRRARDERGSVTIEQVLWAVAVIAIVAIVVKVIQEFVGDEADKIRSE